jgi:hypothetical protein
MNGDVAGEPHYAQRIQRASVSNVIYREFIDRRYDFWMLGLAIPPKTCIRTEPRQSAPVRPSISAMSGYIWLRAALRDPMYRSFGRPDPLRDRASDL